MINSISSSMVAANAQAYKDEESKIAAQKSRDIKEVTEQNKVAQIKESIANNEYKIDLQKTSEKMALDLLNL
ncbi:hypothetical protein BKN38_01535 [Helicobacter sp. CLO-3]|uniref:flagellar biosynthesis anti-sigma factor FlgM n=1 Tax=unclassified Helicobacter TaxID=2593540 RepID=UPI000804A449|nr:MULTISPECIES: flagellar biosynthesis anti-sigma factor FlgM [unclassified Helicobacter]OBV29784.1 hypothetical protein BA723_00335 [Helicobacter sp. CLO-3]OHU85238.1 hypothetical protein BKN38_01535 [Helicobacter sp. CLO-3]